MSAGGSAADVSAGSDQRQADDGSGNGKGQYSYRYWVNPRGDGKEAAAPDPQPRKLTEEEAKKMHRVDSQGSVWNQGGTWEEKTLNEWAKSELSDLLRISCSVLKDGSTYSISTHLETVSGDTTLVVVRNKKRPGYLLDISLKLQGSSDAEGSKAIEGTARLVEATYGETDDIHLEVNVDRSKAGLNESSAAKLEQQLHHGLLQQVKSAMLAFEDKLRQR